MTEAARKRRETGSTLYGPHQSRFARNLEATSAGSGFEFVSLDRGFHASSPLTITAAPYSIGIARRAEAR